MNNNRQAFTMIEMVVSIAVIVMVSGIFIANYHSTGKRTDLIMTAQEVVANIHKAQNNSLGSVKYGNSVPSGGWGIHFSLDSPNTYTVFADLDAPDTSGYMEMNATEDDPNKGARVVNLSKDIKIDEIKIGGVDCPKANISFLPPDPQTNIYNGSSTSTTATIIFKETQNNSIKTIKVNFLGLAEVVD